MNEQVPTFFYGGLINPVVMARVGLVEREKRIASLSGYQIEIKPWVTLRPQALSVAFGIVMPATHEELNSVYAKLAVRYAPWPVLVRSERDWIPALTYLAEPMTPRDPDADHVRPLLEAARGLGFPGWYIEEIESFLLRG
jgi:hypothetical protein